jgi:hypothetical protein
MEWDVYGMNVGWREKIGWRLVLERFGGRERQDDLEKPW